MFAYLLAPLYKLWSLEHWKVQKNHAIINNWIQKEDKLTTMTILYHLNHNLHIKLNFQKIDTHDHVSS